jgi:hypothetical protein
MTCAVLDASLRQYLRAGRRRLGVVWRLSDHFVSTSTLDFVGQDLFERLEDHFVS